MEYAVRLNNGAVFKRLGYLLERFAPEEANLVNECRSRMSKGNTKIDPALAADKLVTKWRLWVPNNWATGEAR
jgi:predicted transcriptional regulator of viral defense system